LSFATCALLFCIVFSYFAQLLSFSKVLFVYHIFLTFTGATSLITLLTFELKESRRKSTESADILNVKGV